ncbi:MAG TPA: DNA repair protein RecO [Candidatus Saccharimonadales bacterium]
MSKIIRTKAIVLRRTNYGEADRILQLLTPEHGKVSAIAKGVRREKSKLAGGIELFARLDLTVNFGKSDLGIITGSRLEQFYGSILADYDRLQFAYEVVKQMNKAAETLDEPAFFDLLDQTLACLDDDKISLKAVQTWFWLQLAILLGVGLNLATDDKGMKLVEDAMYDFDEVQVVFVFREKGRFSSDHIKLLRLLSAQPPSLATKVEGIEKFIDDCLWLAERASAH